MAPHTLAGQPPGVVPDVRDHATALSMAEPTPSPHTLTVLARPDIAALIEQVRSLTARQHAALAEQFRANHRLYSLDQVRICYRVSMAVPHDHPHHAAVRALVWRIAAKAPGGQYAAAVAASDMAFVLLAGELLDADERALFDAPWQAVVGAVEPAAATVGEQRAPLAAPWPLTEDNRVGDETFALAEQTALALLVADPTGTGGVSRVDEREAAFGASIAAVARS
ncbi:MAG: hypothetical protein V7603_5170 [Micromonosporaceae bacterium]